MDAKRADFTTGSGVHDKPNRRGVLRAMFIALTVSLAVLSAAYISGAFSLQETEAASMQETERALESFAELDDRVAEVESLGEDDVEDAKCIVRLQSALDTAQVVRNLSASDVEILPVIGSYGRTARSIETNDSLISNARAAYDRLEDALDAVEESHAAHLLRIAREGLEDSCTAAQETYDVTDGRVADSSTRDALKSELDSASQLMADESADADALDAAADSIDAAREKVERSNAEWSAAQARSRASSSYGGGYSTGTGDGAWHVSYRGTDDSSTANADGSVSEWRDGYYIAHDWSYGGGQIASKPGTVVVNGRTYRYVSSMVVPRSTTWDEVSGFVYANNGIGFQTCYGDGYLITHYEPM